MGSLFWAGAGQRGKILLRRARARARGKTQRHCKRSAWWMWAPGATKPCSDTAGMDSLATRATAELHAAEEGSGVTSMCKAVHN